MTRSEIPDLTPSAIMGQVAGMVEVLPNPVPAARPVAERERAKELYFSGMTLAQVAQAMSIPANTIIAWAARYKWANDKLRNAVATAIKLSPGGRNSLRNAGDNLRNEVADVLRHQVAILKENPAKNIADLATSDGTQGQAAILKTVVDTAATVHGWGKDTIIGVVMGDDWQSVHDDQAIEVESTEQPQESLQGEPTSQLSGDTTTGSTPVPQ